MITRVDCGLVVNENSTDLVQQRHLSAKALIKPSNGVLHGLFFERDHKPHNAAFEITATRATTI